MIKALALRLPFPLFALLACSLGCASACQGEAEPAPSNAAGSSSAGAAGSSVNAAGTPATAGSAASGGRASAGSAGQASAAGSSTGGAAAGAPQGGQAGASVAGASGSGGSGGVGDLPPLEECPNQPSLDRLTQWSATNEGTMVPASGSILLKEGADYVGKVHFVGGGWHVVPVLVANEFDVTADLSKAAAITLTYSATAELHVQLRSKSHWSGGDQYATTLPSTGGKKETHVFSFAEASWKSLFGTPVLSFADTLKEGMGLVFVGDGENTIAFYGLRIDGYSPPCE